MHQLHDLRKYPQSPLRYAVSFLETEKIGGKFSPPPEKRGRFFRKKGGIFYSLLYTELYTYCLIKSPYYTRLLVIDYL